MARSIKFSFAHSRRDKKFFKNFLGGSRNLRKYMLISEEINRSSKMSGPSVVGFELV